MSNKSRCTRKQLPSRQFPWFWLAGGGILLLIVASLVLWGASSGARPATTSQEAGPPRLTVGRTTVDEGYVQFDVPVRTIFNLSNTGDQPLQILGEPRVELVEGCWPPRAVVSSTTLKPGQEALLTLDYTMHPGMGGPHQFHIRLRTNDPIEPEKLLVARSNWGP